MADYVEWLFTEQFSIKCIAESLIELVKVSVWMKTIGVGSIKSIGEREIEDYLKARWQGGKLTSKQRYLSHIKPFYYYVKERIDGSLEIPLLTVKVLRATGTETKANTNEIEILWEGLASGQSKGPGALMLALVLGYGFTLKTLTRLQGTIEGDVLHYEEQQPVRLGKKQRQISLQNAPEWLKKLLAGHRSSGYLFQTSYSFKRGLPVSAEYCQREVQKLVKAMLGYAISVNRLERGALI